jgi:hypothetical protein
MTDAFFLFYYFYIYLFVSPQSHSPEVGACGFLFYDHHEVCPWPTAGKDGILSHPSTEAKYFSFCFVSLSQVLNPEWMGRVGLGLKELAEGKTGHSIFFSFIYFPLAGSGLGFNSRALSDSNTSCGGIHHLRLV